MADLALSIGDETQAIHSSGSALRDYEVICDALEISGVSYHAGDSIELPEHIALTALALNQVKEVI